MASISASEVKTLRERTGAGMMDCKQALAENGGDMDAAVDWLRTKGLAAAARKAGRVAAEGLVGVAVSGRAAAVVEVNSETDFVARTDDFRDLAHNLAMQVAAMSPSYVDESSAPEGEELDASQDCLLNQPFIRDPSKTVQELVNETVGKLGENVRVRRFSRFSLGE